MAWLLVGVLAVALIWMNTGVFGIQPSLMSGPSMNPTLWAGDVVIVRKVAPETIQVGDIVRFHRDNIDVVHRVKEIQNEAGQITFITAGITTTSTIHRSAPTVRGQGDFHHPQDRLYQHLAAPGHHLGGRIGMKGFAGRYGSILMVLTAVLVLGMLTMPVGTALWSEVLGISGSISTGNWATPTPPPGQSGTSIEAALEAYSFSIPDGERGVTGQVCVTNTGIWPTTGLAMEFSVEYKPGKGKFLLLEGASTYLTALEQLQPGQGQCYAYSIPFTPQADAQYRNVAHVTILNHSGRLPGGPHCAGPEPCPFGPDPNAGFAFDAALFQDPRFEEIVLPEPSATPLPTGVGVTPTMSPTVTPTMTPSATPSDTVAPSVEPPAPTPTLTETPLLEQVPEDPTPTEESPTAEPTLEPTAEPGQPSPEASATPIPTEA